jgi:RNA 3'-phosphate cyclase
MLTLDGSYGEGGGQVLRTALSLSALLGMPVRLINVRAGRPKPGLRPQHLTCVTALARLCQAQVEGAALGSQDLTFRPGPVQPGRYLFDVAEKTGSAGSVSLIAQALLPPLLASGGPSTLTLRGGTHVPWSPTAHYFDAVFLPALEQMGTQVKLEMGRWGWYPKGGGELRLNIMPVKSLKPVQWRHPAPAGGFRAISASSRLPEHVARRQAARLHERAGPEFPVEIIAANSPDPGSLAFIWGPGAGFSSLGARGKPAEQVADEAIDAYLHHRQGNAALDPHLADQLALYLALAQGASNITTSALTSHLRTNIWVIEQYLGRCFQVSGALGEPGEISSSGSG